MKRCGHGFVRKSYVIIKYPEYLEVGDNVGLNDFVWISIII